MADPRLEFSDFEVAIPSGQRRALVVTPAERIRVGHPRLGIDPSTLGAPSAVDDEIVRQVASWQRPVDVVLLRSWGGDENRSWGFDPSLGEAETDALAYRLMQDQLAFYRQVIAVGVFALVATDLTGREFDALVRASVKLGRELGTRAKEGEGDPALVADRFILDHFSLWTTRPFDEFVLQGLPELFNLVDRYRDKLASFASASRPG